MSGRGRGRGRGKKRQKTEALPAAAASLGALDSEEEVVANDHGSRSNILATPLGSLMRIEATLWTNSRGRGSISFDDFYSLARAHEWMGSSQKANNGGKMDQSKLMATTRVPKALSNLSNDVYALVDKLTEEERLLFDFTAVSAWDPKDFPHLYPLYRLHPSPKMKLEILQQPQAKETKSAGTATKSKPKVSTRSEILGNMYHHSRKYFSFGTTAGSAPHIWWEHTKNVAQTILDHRKSITASANIVESYAEKLSSKSLKSNTVTESSIIKSPAKQNGGKKLTLEERVRARSLLNPANIKSKQSSKDRADSSAQAEAKMLLELADALRSYSQRRGVISSGVGGSALDRLKNRGAIGGASGAHATKNIARITVMDLIKDARVSWNSVVNESIDRNDTSGGTKSRGGGATPMVNIDLSRVLFHIRLKMVSSANVSDKRQMELQLLALIEKLAKLVPKWIHLRKAPATLTSTTKFGSGTSTGQKNATTSNQKLNIKHSIIVIQNDSVDYNKEVRAKLGGRVHNPTTKSNGSSKLGVTTGSKRALQDMEQQSQTEVKGPTSAADAIVPPSFQRLYGKALAEK